MDPSAKKLMLGELVSSGDQRGMNRLSSLNFPSNKQ
jgi:hypothetical protein